MNSMSIFPSLVAMRQSKAKRITQRGNPTQCLLASTATRRHRPPPHALTTGLRDRCDTTDSRTRAQSSYCCFARCVKCCTLCILSVCVAEPRSNHFPRICVIRPSWISRTTHETDPLDPDSWTSWGGDKMVNFVSRLDMPFPSNL